MAVISRVTTWSDGQTLTASALNGEFNNILSDYNGGITNANISASAAIATSKINVTFPSGTIVGTSDTQTLTNKRITKRVGTVADAATITPTADDSDVYTVTALAQTATIAAPSGTPTNGQTLVIRLLDNGTARALTWNSIYTVIGVTLPTTTTLSKYTYVGCIYNSTSSKWDVLAVQTQV
jgi:hypothetical protein